MQNPISLDELKGTIIKYIDNGEKGVQPLICVTNNKTKEHYYITITNSHKFNFFKE